MSDIYLDNNATTVLDRRVLEAMLPTLTEVGNPSSAHQAGQRARNAVEKARRQVAELLGSSTREVVFTSGATEANNLALKGAARSAQRTRRRIVSVTTEHPSILQSLHALAGDGMSIVLVGVDSEGVPDHQALERAVNEETLIVSVMAANNETGVLASLEDIAEVAHQAGALIHTDATQLLTWGTIDVDALDIDLLSLSGHKMHGPQGVGALYVRREVSRRLVATQHGGGHEAGLRSGTLNTAGIVGLGAAAALSQEEGAAGASRVRSLREALLTDLRRLASPIVVNGHPEQRLPGTLNVAFPGADAEAIMAGAPTVAVANGSACSTGHPGPSHVLTAMGINADQASCSLRFGLSRFTTADDVSKAAALIAASVSRVRHTSREAVAI